MRIDRKAAVAAALLCAASGAVAQQVHWPSVHSRVGSDAKLEARINRILAKMTVEEKVGQIVQADISAVTPEDVRKYKLGSILAGGNSVARRQ